MPRYQVIIEYDGTPFVGWQRQENGPSIQTALEQAVRKLTGDEVAVFGAGRTDAGVHARGQVAHFDLSSEWAAGKIRDGLNYHLKPDPVAVLSCNAVAAGFDARFDAVKRSYLYCIINRRAPLALESQRAWAVKTPLDHEAMHEAARHLIGKHDFTTFRSINCQAKSALRTLDEVRVERNGDRIEICVKARSFLHNQVRSIAGSLKMVGEGKWSPEHIKDILAAKDRAACGPVAPAHGLYLMQVDYAL
jgi:tRNA pseudouridine38-40 synthase